MNAPYIIAGSARDRHESMQRLVMNTKATQEKETFDTPVEQQAHQRVLDGLLIAISGYQKLIDIEDIRDRYGAEPTVAELHPVPEEYEIPEDTPQRKVAMTATSIGICVCSLFIMAGLSRWLAGWAGWL